MSDDDETRDGPTEPGAEASEGHGEVEAPTDAELDAYDLDHDGEISLIEAERARLGLVDAHLEELVQEPGIKGKLAKAAHKVLDALDND